MKEGERLRGSQPREGQGRAGQGRAGQGRARAERSLSVDKGQRESRPQKGSSPEHLSKRKATETITAKRGRQRPGEVGSCGSGKVWILFYGLMDAIEGFWFLYFSFFLWLHMQHLEAPGLGGNWSYSCWPMPQPRQHWIQAASTTYATAASAMLDPEQCQGLDPHIYLLSF